MTGSKNALAGITAGRQHNTPLWWLIAGLTVIHIVPIWAFKYFPSQDGPSHIENSYVLAHYFDKGSVYGQYFDLNLRPVPNWFSHATMAGLMKVVPPLAAEKLLLTGYVILFVLGMLYFLRSTHEERGLAGSAGGSRDWLVLLTFPFIYNYLLHSGYYNFCIGFPLGFLAIGYWWRRRAGQPDPRRIVGLNLIFVLLYFCSILSQLLSLASVLVLAALYYRRRVGRTLGLAAALTPSYLLPIYYVATQNGEVGGRLAGRHLVRYLAVIGSLGSFDSREDYVGLVLALLIAALALYSFRRVRTSCGVSSAEGGGEPERRFAGRVFPAAGGFLLLSIMLALAYFFAPNSGYGGSTISRRLCLYPFIMIVPWLAARTTQRLQRAAGIFAVCVTLAHVGITTHYYRTLNRELAEYNSGVSLVEKNKTVVAINFDYRGDVKVGVFRHAGSYYCLTSGAIDLANYEADKTYFPLRYKASINPWTVLGPIESRRGNLRLDRYPGTIDYILLWSAPSQFPALAWIEANYGLAHSQGRLRIYERKQTGPDRPRKTR